MRAYHDEEWGTPVHGDAELFERLSLEAFQAGLSWQTILNKREAFRLAFHEFEPAVVGAFDDATIGNAKVLLGLMATHGSFDGYLRSLVPGPAKPLPATAVGGDIPNTTPVSDALSADLKRRGMRFVGSTVAYAFMQSVGLVDDHLPGCFRYRG
jgi:DNA-3-methyladenine glycosylase I